MYLIIIYHIATYYEDDLFSKIAQLCLDDGGSKIDVCNNGTFKQSTMQPHIQTNAL